MHNITGAGHGCASRLLEWDEEEEMTTSCRDSWAQQFTRAFYCNGSPKGQAGAGAKDWFFHCLSLFWKVLFAIVPPPMIGGGVLCFISALTMIGIVTAVVSEMASLLGC